MVSDPTTLIRRAGRILLVTSGVLAVTWLGSVAVGRMCDLPPGLLVVFGALFTGTYAGAVVMLVRAATLAGMGMARNPELRTPKAWGIVLISCAFAVGLGLSFVLFYYSRFQAFRRVP